MNSFGLPEEIFKKAREKTGFEEASVADLAIRETVRFLYLSAHAGRPLFFTGDETVDRVWHFLISETGFYADFCNRLRSGTFIHHRGIPYSGYCADKTPVEMLEEHFSWLASYVANFGEIEPDALLFLPVAQDLMRRLGRTLPELNGLARQLVTDSKNDHAPFCLEEKLSALQARESELDQNSLVLFATIRQMLRGVHSVSGRGIENEELIRVFSVSTALGFAIWQHLAAVERLEGAPDWIERNPDRFEAFQKGIRTLGLATTHLAKEAGSPLRGERIEGGYRVGGVVPWCSGYSSFDEVVIGFDAGDEIVFALTPMPGPLGDFAPWEVDLMRLQVLDSTRTFSAKVRDLFIPDRDVIGTREKGRKVPVRETRYRLPEIGMALGTIREIRKLNPGGSKFSGLEAAVLGLEERVTVLLQIVRDSRAPLGDEHQIEKADLIRNAVRLYSIASGGAALLHASSAARRSMEAILLDVVIQPPSVIKKKIEASGL